MQMTILERQNNRQRVRGQTQQDTDHLIGPRRRKFFHPTVTGLQSDHRARSEPRDQLLAKEAVSEGVESQVQLKEPENQSPQVVAPSSRKSSLTRSRSLGPVQRKRSSFRSEYKEAFKPWTIQKIVPTASSEVTATETVKSHVDSSNGVNGGDLSNGHQEVMSTSLPPENTVFWSGDQPSGAPGDDIMRQKKHFTTPTKGPGVLFHLEKKPVEVSSEDMSKLSRKRKTEYKSQFKPFWKYVYIPGEGRFKKVKEVHSDQLDSSCKSSSETGLDWTAQCRERHDCALAFQKRSEAGHPILGRETLADIYRKTMYTPKDRSLAALSLATTRLRLQDLKTEKTGKGGKSSPEKRVTRSVSGEN